MLYFSKLRVFSVLIFTLVISYFTISNFTKVDDEFFSKNIKLGLDLQGGSYLLLEIDNEPVITQRLQSKVLEFKKFFKDKDIKVRNFVIEDKSIIFDVENSKIEDVKSLLDDDKSEINPYFQQYKSHQFNFENMDASFKLEFSDYGLVLLKNSSLDQAIEIVRRRVDEVGTNEPNILKRGNDRILVELPGLDDPGRIKSLLGKTANLTFQFISSSSEESFGTEKLSFEDGSSEAIVSKRIVLSGDNLMDAKPTMNNQTNETVSAPEVREPIIGGNGQISGNFTFQSATDLALLLRSGALPAPLNIIEERTVGPDLGKDSINAGIMSLIIGFILVVAFMFYKYRFFGLIANLALISNLFLLVGILTLFEATLTLPGIAGIILTVGMAVDANVLIFERIKEELKNENNSIVAFDSGYTKSRTTILDANITTLIAAVILFFMGSGPIKGFSITLGVGILTTLFSVYFIARLITAYYVIKNKHKEKLI